MSRTSIDCPSCNRRICIALKPPLASALNLNDPLYLDGLNSTKEHDLRDLLYVHEELIMRIRHLEEQLEPKKKKKNIK